MRDSQASPTADYDMLATREVAQDIKDSKSAFDNMDRKVQVAEGGGGREGRAKGVGDVGGARARPGSISVREGE